MTTTDEKTTVWKSPNGFWYLGEPAAGSEAPKAIDDSSPEWQAATAAELEKQRLFDATRPPCPPWCDLMCETEGHFGDAILHVSGATKVAAEADQIGDVGFIWLQAQRHDSLTDSASVCIEVDIADSGSLIEERAVFTAAQARQFAAELLRHADLIDPEPKVPAREVRVGDWFPVGDVWQYVYGVDVDEPSNAVQIFTTADRDTFPELDGNEDGHQFTPDEMVQVRRVGAR